MPVWPSAKWNFSVYRHSTRMVCILRPDPLPRHVNLGSEPRSQIGPLLDRRLGRHPGAILGSSGACRLVVSVAVPVLVVVVSRVFVAVVGALIRLAGFGAGGVHA
jgi:hypothetical protein